MAKKSTFKPGEKALIMDVNFKAKRNDYIYRCFRDVADCDYISARVLHRFKLFDQFSWAALQAIEKYLKTILLIYDKNTKDIKHDLIKGLDRVESIEDIKWDFDDRIREFLEYLTIYGGDRYFTFPRYTEGLELFMLDRSVWKIRRYCEDFNFLKKLQRQVGSVYDNRIKHIQSNECFKNANKFRLRNKGYLERVLDTRRFLKQREQLVYKNAYYGTHRKRRIIYKRIITSATPSHFIFEEIYSWVTARVTLSEKVRRFLEAKWSKPK